MYGDFTGNLDKKKMVICLNLKFWLPNLNKFANVLKILALYKYFPWNASNEKKNENEKNEKCLFSNTQEF